MGFQLANITILNDYYFYGFIPLVFILLFMINKRYIKMLKNTNLGKIIGFGYSFLN